MRPSTVAPGHREEQLLGMIAPASRNRAGTTWNAGTPTKLFEGPYYRGGGLPDRTYDVSADGQRFLMVKEAGADEGAAPPQIVVVQNWFEELKRLVPVN